MTAILIYHTTLAFKLMVYWNWNWFNDNNFELTRYIHDSKLFKHILK